MASIEAKSIILCSNVLYNIYDYIYVIYCIIFL